MAQPILHASNGRAFTCFPVAVQAVIINPAEEILLLSSPKRNKPNEWQVISGGLEANETLMQGTLREVAEEAGPQVKTRLVATIHADTFYYDGQAAYMVGVYTVLAYQGGPVEPGDDMRGSKYRWWSLEDLETGLAEGAISLKIPPNSLWLLRRAVSAFRLWKQHSDPIEWPHPYHPVSLD